MNKKFLTLAILTIVNLANFSVVDAAENPSADRYRKIFSSGNFYLEYKDTMLNRIIAEENGKRMERAGLSSQMITLFSILNPIGAIFGGGEMDRYPEAMNVGNKFFQFTDEETAMMIEESHMRDENLNPREGWNAAKMMLSIPAELAVFAWNDPYRTNPRSLTEPFYQETNKKSVHGENYSCDRYTSECLNGTHDKVATVAYDMCYNDKNELKIAQMIILRNGKDYLVNELEIERILDKIPEKKFQIRKKAKAYAAGTGDMNDLLENPVEIGNVREMIGDAK